MNEGRYEGWEIYTIGHSNITSDRLIELLKQHHVQTLVDVRSAPYSQWATQFNRETLAQTLAECGIRYAYAGEYLGGRPKDPTCYKNGVVPEGKANYLELVVYPEVAKRPWYRKGIARLMQLADDGPAAVMCSEEDPSHCHRHHLIAQTLLEMGVTVLHIRGTGELERARTLAEEAADRPDEPQQLSLFDDL